VGDDVPSLSSVATAHDRVAAADSVAWRVSVAGADERRRAASTPGAANGATPEPTPGDPASPVLPASLDRAPAPVRVVVQAAGDYLLHARVQESARHHGGFGYLTSALAPVLAQGHVNVVNLETPLATVRNAPTASPPVLAGPAEAAIALRDAGFHAAALANNHAYDQGFEGVRETVEAVRAAGMVPVGGGADAAQARAPRYLDVCGDGTTREADRRDSGRPRAPGCARVAVLSFTEWLNDPRVLSRVGPDRPQVADWTGPPDLARVRAAAGNADVVVVAIHWGIELQTVQTGHQERLARALCAAGAHVVAGSHPHVLQPVVRLGRKDGSPCVVAYSLGNLISNQGLKYKRGGVEPVEPGSAQARGDTRDGALLRVTFEVAPGSPDGAAAGARVVEVAAVPLFTHNNWLERFGDPDFHNDIFVAPLATLLADPARARHHALYRERRAAIARALGAEVTLVD
jgi:poly-gamma-glutamate synthesis protein (capsule biosynthesis protein)